MLVKEVAVQVVFDHLVTNSCFGILDLFFILQSMVLSTGLFFVF